MTINEAEIQAGLAPTPGYRYARRVGPQLFVAGQVPMSGTGDIVGVDDPRQQTNRCLENLATLLDVHGFSNSDICQVTIHVVGGQENLREAWAAVVEWFDDAVPPATLLGANRLGYAGQLVEVDAVVIESSGIV